VSGAGIGCAGPGCTATNCAGPGCTATGCTGPGCTATGCAGPGCTATGCADAGCTATGCAGAGCTATGCAPAGGAATGCAAGQARETGAGAEGQRWAGGAIGVVTSAGARGGAVAIGGARAVGIGPRPTSTSPSSRNGDSADVESVGSGNGEDRSSHATTATRGASSSWASRGGGGGGARGGARVGVSVAAPDSRGVEVDAASTFRGRARLRLAVVSEGATSGPRRRADGRSVTAVVVSLSAGCRPECSALDVDAASAARRRLRFGVGPTAVSASASRAGVASEVDVGVRRAARGARSARVPLDDERVRAAWLGPLSGSTGGVRPATGVGPERVDRASRSAECSSWGATGDRNSNGASSDTTTGIPPKSSRACSQSGTSRAVRSDVISSSCSPRSSLASNTSCGVGAPYAVGNAPGFTTGRRAPYAGGSAPPSPTSTVRSSKGSELPEGASGGAGVITVRDPASSGPPAPRRSPRDTGPRSSRVGLESTRGWRVCPPLRLLCSGWVTRRCAEARTCVFRDESAHCGGVVARAVSARRSGGFEPGPRALGPQTSRGPPAMAACAAASRAMGTRYGEHDT
jgi:hypothetical protein